MALNYTSVSRIFTQEPALEDISNFTSAQAFTFAEDAEAEVNLAISRNYTVPVTGGPAILQAIATDIAIYRILSRRVFTQERLQNSTWPNAFKEAREILKAIATGNQPLINSAGTIVTARTDLAKATSNNDTYFQTFNELGQLDWIQDEDKIDDLEDERSL